MNGHRDSVMLLLEQSANPNAVDINKRTAAHRGAVCGQEECVDALLNCNADPNIRDINGHTPITHASICDHIGILGTLIQSGGDAYGLDNSRYSALHWACFVGNESCAELLLEENSTKAFDGNAFSPIHCASLRDKEACVDILLESLGDDIVNVQDSKGRTALHAASFNDCCECMQTLLQHGGNINCVDNSGQTPLICAATKANQNMLDGLLEAGADVNLSDNNKNMALHHACLIGNETCALQILNQITNELISHPNTEGKTPLHIAAKKGLQSVVAMLIDRGCNVIAEDNEGYWPALSCAPTKEVAECLRVILLAMLPPSDVSSLTSTLQRTVLTKSSDQTADQMHVDE